MTPTQMQFRAFVAVVFAALAVALAPVIVAGIRGESLPEGLIDIADKSVVAFAGLLGTIGALLFRQNGADHARAGTLEKTVDLARETLAATPPGPVQAEIVNTPERPAQVENVQ